LWYNKENDAGAERMGYIYALWNWLKTDKTRRDFMDYVRAAVIIAAVMAMVRIMMDMITTL
jgi:hypothetical protein